MARNKFFNITMANSFKKYGPKNTKSSTLNSQPVISIRPSDINISLIKTVPFVVSIKSIPSTAIINKDSTELNAVCLYKSAFGRTNLIPAELCGQFLMQLLQSKQCLLVSMFGTLLKAGQGFVFPPTRHSFVLQDLQID